jgi:hypothetical protein
MNEDGVCPLIFIFTFIFVIALGLSLSLRVDPAEFRHGIHKTSDDSFIQFF